MSPVFGFVVCTLFFHFVYSQTNTSSELTCPAPVTPENSFAVGEHTKGSVVKILCDEGYFRMGEPSRIICQANGQWSEANVSCIAQSCGDPGELLNGQRIGWLFQYGNNVTFKCLPGYILRGSKTRTCLSNQTWSGHLPVCEPISCEEPPVVTDAQMFGGGFVYKAHVHYTCREGYQIQGSDNLECGVEGKWIGKTPVCKAVTCDDPGTPKHGTREGSKFFKFNSKVTFNCNKGYILFGSLYRTCNNEGQWTGVQPYCVECAKVDTPVFIRSGIRFVRGLIKEKRRNVVTVLTNAQEETNVLILGRGTQHYAIVEDKVPPASDILLGTRVIAKAGNGKYTFAEVKTIDAENYEVIFEDGKKSTRIVTINDIRTLDPPRFCAICPDPGTPQLGFREDELDEFIPGMQVEYGCRINTEMTGSGKRTCLASEEWTGIQPTCNITSCFDLDVLPPDHGKRTGDNFKIGERVTFSCDEGYELKGESNLTCLPDGQWSASAPVCKDLCDKISCEPWKKCVYDLHSGQPKCVCRKTMECPANYDPLCGSDATRYNNYCILKAKACRENTILEAVANGSCIPSAVCRINPISNCRGYFQSFYFNQETKRCKSIIVGGCHPSGWNGFHSMEECNRTCLVDVCSQPTVPGPCKKSIPRWAFNPKTGRCKKFKYGGCFGNENNFESKEQCTERCPSDVKRSESLKCPSCPQTKLREACKTSTLAVIGKVQDQLPEDAKKKHARFQVKIQHVLKSKNGSLPEGSAVVSIPYMDSPSCPCPSLPMEKFILIGRVITERTKQDPKPGLVITPPAFVHPWSEELLDKIEKKCGKSLNFED